MDDMDTILCKKFTRFLMQRAEQFIVMRREPVDGFSISFLVTHTHLENYWKHKLIDFIIEFMEEINKEISDMKIAINDNIYNIHVSTALQSVSRQQHIIINFVIISP